MCFCLACTLTYNKLECVVTIHQHCYGYHLLNTTLTWFGEPVNGCLSQSPSHLTINALIKIPREGTEMVHNTQNMVNNTNGRLEVMPQATNKAIGKHIAKVVLDVYL